MASQHLTTQHTSTPHLDEYLKGIRDEFDRLNNELDETRKQRDQYITRYKSQVKELQELRQTLENNTVTHHDDACEVTDDDPTPISPVSSSSGYYSFFDGEDAVSDRLPNQEYAKEIGHLEDDGNQEVDNLGESDGSSHNEVNVGPSTPSPFLQAEISPANKPGFSPWDVEYDFDPTAALNLNLTHKLTIRGGKRVAFSMDGIYLATASRIVTIFETATGKRISVMKDLYHDEKFLPGYTCLEFSPDSKYLATGEMDGNIRIWIISQKKVRNTFRHRDIVNALNFSPNGRYIVTCSSDQTVVIWRLRDGYSRVLTTSEFYSSRSVRLSLDGRFIASGGTQGEMVIWNVRTGNVVVRWQGHSNLVGSLVFTPDGKSLLSGSWDDRVKQWDVSFLSSLGMANPSISGVMEISYFNGHTSWITSVAISPDGKWIASGSWDNTVRIWNAHEASLHCVLHNPKVFSVDFSPVGNCLAIGDFSEDITIWNYVAL